MMQDCACVLVTILCPEVVTAILDGDLFASRHGEGVLLVVELRVYVFFICNVCPAFIVFKVGEVSYCLHGGQDFVCSTSILDVWGDIWLGWCCVLSSSWAQ